MFMLSQKTAANNIEGKIINKKTEDFNKCVISVSGEEDFKADMYHKRFSLTLQMNKLELIISIKRSCQFGWN